MRSIELANLIPQAKVLGDYSALPGFIPLFVHRKQLIYLFATMVDRNRSFTTSLSKTPFHDTTIPCSFRPDPANISMQQPYIQYD